MKNTTLFILTLLFLGTTFSCQQVQEIDDRNHAIFDYYQKEIQTFKISPDKTETIVGNEGTKLTIDGNSLETADGKKISGNVEIQLSEFYQTEDMLLANLSTTSDNKILETGGMLNLSATYNDQEVVVKKGKEIKIEFASVKKEGMNLFYAENENGRLNWKPKAKSTQPSTFGFARQMRAGQRVAWQLHQKNNIFGSSSFGWINCDRFLQLQNLTNFTITHDTIFKPSLFLVFHDIKSIMPPMYKKTYAQFINLPIGHEATLIAFCEKEGKTYFSAHEIVIEKEKSLTIDLEEVPMDHVKEKIKQMTGQRMVSDFSK